MILNSEAEKRFDKIDDALTKTLSLLNDHITQSGIRDATLEQRVVSAHKRIDGHDEIQKERRGNAAAVWIGVILAFLSSLFAAAIALFNFKGDHK
jgi:hypothetical protein